MAVNIKRLLPALINVLLFEHCRWLMLTGRALLFLATSLVLFDDSCVNLLNHHVWKQK